MKSNFTSVFYSICCLILFQVVVLSNANAQGCNLKTGVLAFACTSGTSLHYEDGIDCYSEIRMILDVGTFYAWTANAADGWIVEQVTPSELLITHINGTFPSGDHTMVDFLYYTPGGGPTLLILLYPDLCVMEGCENQHMLPGCGEVCISGTIYRECGDEPFTDQPALEGFLVELTDDMGNIVAEYTTFADGTYSFCDLPPGNYEVQAAKEPGWSPSVPAPGKYALELTPGTEQFRDFGSCPECTCDDWEIILQQEVTESDTAFLNLFVNAENLFCLERYEITLDSGEIIKVELIPDGWEAEIINPQLVVLQRAASFNDWTTFVFHRLRMAIDFGIKTKGQVMSVRLNGAGNQPPEPICMDSIILEDPTKYKEFTCCPDGYSAGPELVVDGQFANSGFPATDYTPWVSGPFTPGHVAIFDQAGAFAVNNSWVCPGFINIWDTYLAVDGSLPTQAAWKQQVSGITPNGEYQFCTLVSNLVSSFKNFADPEIILEIVDDITPSNVWSSPPLIVPENPKQWVPHTLSWTAPNFPSSSYTLRIRSNSPASVGNDFALDRISFRSCTAVPKDTCCKELQAFCDDLEAGIVFSTDSCNVTMDLGALLPCYTIEWVDWGQGPEFGPWTSSTFPPPMHTFLGNGTYPISYLAIAYNDSNFICQEKVIEDTIVVQCKPCYCNEPEINLNLNGVDYPLSCFKGAPLVQLPCAAGDILLSGFFGCETADGELCGETPVHWSISGPNNYYDAGLTTNFQALLFSQDLISAPGQYTVTYSTLCLGEVDSCLCVVQWLQLDCSDCIEDFEMGSLGQWQSLNGQVSTITDPFTGTMVLKGNDNQGASWMYNNSSDYNGDWTQKFNNCLCFDIRYDNGNPSNPGTGSGVITIFQGNDPLNFTKRATFVVNTPIGNTWTRVCVPVKLSNGTTYPSNQYGQWTSTSLADFDMVIQGVSGIGIPLDFAGGTHPSEMVFVDNFCVEKCIDCCVAPLTFNNLIAQGFTVTKNGCLVTVTATQFDSCYQFTTPPILNGEDVPQIITPAVGSWTFNIPENGYHQICVTVFDECNIQEMCTSVKIDCHPPVVDTSCCAYSMYFVNKYTDNLHIKKVRVSGICGTEICCADPDEWVQVDGTPNYIEWFEDNLNGVPNGDAIDNDFIIYLKRSASPQNLEVEWFDVAGVVVCRHLLELGCDMPYNEDDDWTLNTSTTALNDPNLFVFAARAVEEDDESDCEEANEDRLTNACDVSYTVACSGGTDYVVNLSGPSGFDKYFWEVIYAPSGVTAPTINSEQNPTFTVTEGGSYSLSLIAVTASFDTCTNEGDIDIPIVEPDFDAVQLPCGYMTQFVAYGMYAASDVVSWSCPGYSSFPSSGNIITFDFQGVASVSVTMTIEDQYGCTHEITKQVEIVECEAGVQVDKYCPDPCSNGTTNVTVHFNNLSKGGQCPINYTWDYGDGTVITYQNPTAGETHTYLGLPCPLPVGGVNYTVTLMIQDAGNCISTATTTVNISSCQANFTYKACPDGRVDFYGDEPGTWDFTGSIDIAKRPYSDKKDKDGRQKHVRVRYGQSGIYLVKYTPHCPNGSECEILQEVIVDLDCCTKNHRTKDKAFFSVGSKDYKLKGKFRSTQFVRQHKIVAKTRLRKSVFKIGGHKCWVSSKDFAIIAEFDGKIYGREKADGCNCTFEVDIPASGPNHPVYGPWFVRKAKVQEVWHKRKLHPRKDSITSTHTAEITPVQLIQIKLKLGKDCVRFHWWTDWY